MKIIFKLLVRIFTDLHVKKLFANNAHDTDRSELHGKDNHIAEY